ncbi:hypothetical protein BGZ95_008339 [Linnemannia exigua]|uniref:Crinkler effector protein N-terminal domain-containing protein n=1 Tax=Linnemannia exigua TaxID=604196 RepID=A0AAD4DGD4_9FUNG|nr:hypothetical protein BGZ95_008339 [Linnemannia exigua]
MHSLSRLSPASKTIGDLKKLTKSKKANDFQDVDANQLTLWRVSVPNDSVQSAIMLDSLDDKTGPINPRTFISKLSPESPDDNTYILVQRASLSRSDVGIQIKLERKVACNESVVIATEAASDLRKVNRPCYPQYDHDDCMKLSFHKTYASPSETISDVEDLRRILKIAKLSSTNKMIFSLDTPTKDFSAWTYKDVVSEYNLSEATDVSFEIFPPFTDIKVAPLDSDLGKKVLEQLITEVKQRWTF